MSRKLSRVKPTIGLELYLNDKLGKPFCRKDD